MVGHSFMRCFYKATVTKTLDHSVLGKFLVTISYLLRIDYLLK